MPETQGVRFITQDKIDVEQIPWGTFEWMSKPGLTDAEKLMVIRVDIPPGLGHMFHRHPECEEVIYILEGEAEQWVEQECKTLKSGDGVHIPQNIVHATYNVTDKPCKALAILSPAKFDGPLLIEVALEEPWCNLKKPLELPE